MARPVKYKPEFCEKLVAHFEVPAHREVTRVNSKTGNEYQELVPSQLPTFEQFAHSIGVTHATILNWRNEYPKFEEAYEKAKALQKDILVQNGLLRLYDARFAMFMAVNNTDLVNEKQIKARVDLGDTDRVGSGISDDELEAIAKGEA